jgi:hypothetical protein
LFYDKEIPLSKYHLAQVNIANGKASMESQVMSGFVSRLNEINTLADNSPGFVWRLQTEDGDSTSIQAFDDPLLLINMSVWEDIESLKLFVYKSMHVELIQDRDAWFNKMSTAHQALWWIPAGSYPTINEGKERLEVLQKNGPTENAFSFAQSFGVDQHSI